MTRLGGRGSATGSCRRSAVSLFDRLALVGETLPGSSSGLQLGTVAVKAALRMIGGSDFADVIGDLTGLGAKRVGKLAREAAGNLGVGASTEFSGLHESSRFAVENAVAESFRTAVTVASAERNFVVAAVMGATELSDFVSEHSDFDPGDWSADEAGYFRALTRAVSSLTCDWYAQDPSARQHALVAASGATLRALADHGTILSRIESALDKDGTEKGQSSQSGIDAAISRIVVIPAHQRDGNKRINRWVRWLTWTMSQEGLPVVEGFPTDRADELTVIVDSNDLSPHSTAPIVFLDKTDRETAPGRILYANFSDLGHPHTESRNNRNEIARREVARVIGPLVGVAALETPRIRYDPATSLPKLRQLSSRALSDAASTGSRRFDDRETGDLYVVRDLQTRVLETLEREDLVVISGEAGSGKTSLLWGLAHALVDHSSSRDVYFFSALYLAPEPSTAAILPTDLANAIRSRSLEVESVVLIDTADLLVGEDRSFSALMEAIDVAQAAGAKVVVTSRPAEAVAITAGASPAMALGPFSLSPPRGPGESEFARAVRSHALTYCVNPGDTGDLAQQLLAAAVRETPLGLLAQLPLSLRLLFELYAPGIVPDNVSATGLFERFWTERVVHDTRTWGATRQADTTPDLSSAAVSLAAAMLRQGRPEARVEAAHGIVGICTSATREQVRELCSRGVGLMTPQDTFRFFHQAFFEFAAAKLIVQRPAVLAQVVDRSAGRPDDYFFAAVAEQVWVLGANMPDRGLEAATTTTKYLGATDSEMLRRSLRVAAQSPLRASVAEGLAVVLAACSPVISREYLRFLPRPGAAWQQADTNLLGVTVSRGSNPHRTAAIEVMARLASADPMGALEEVKLIADLSSFPLLAGTSMDRAEVRRLIALLSRHDVEAVLPLLDRFNLRESRIADDTRFSSLLQALAHCSSSQAPLVLEWAAPRAREAHASSQVSAVLAQLHYRTMRHILGRSHGQLVVEFERSLAELVTSSKPTAKEFALFEASLWAASEQPDEAELVQILHELLQHPEPQLHELLHHGCLAVAMNRSSTVRDRLAQALAAGLPAVRRSPQGPAARWADTVRRTLTRPELEADALIEVVECAESLLSRDYDSDTIWLGRDFLLPVLLITANAGVAAAREVIRSLTTNPEMLTDELARVVILQGQSLTEVRAGTADVIEYLAANGGYVELSKLIERVENLPWTRHIEEIVTEQLLIDCRRGNWPDRVRALKLLSALARSGRLELPNFEDVRQMANSMNGSFLSELSGILREGVDRGLYPLSDVVNQYASWTGSPSPLGTRSRVDLVAVLGRNGGPETIDTAVEIAFASPADGGTITPLVGFLKQRTQISIGEKINLIATVGRSLRGQQVTKRAKRDVPGVWRDVIGQVLNHATDHQLLTLAESLQQMAPVFAERVMSRFPPRNDPHLRRMLARIRDDPAVSDGLRRVAALRLQAAMHPMISGWPELDEVLAK